MAVEEKFIVVHHVSLNLFRFKFGLNVVRLVFRSRGGGHSKSSRRFSLLLKALKKISRVTIFREGNFNISFNQES